MNWNDSRLRRAPTKPARKRNRGVEKLTREIREIRGFLLTGAQTISEILSKDGTEGAPMATSGARSDDASALSNETAWVIQRLTAQTGELRAELAGLGVEIRQCGQAYVELLEVAAERLDELVTPARYRR